MDPHATRIPTPRGSDSALPIRQRTTNLFSPQHQWGPPQHYNPQQAQQVPHHHIHTLPLPLPLPPPHAGNDSLQYLPPPHSLYGYQVNIPKYQYQPLPRKPNSNGNSYFTRLVFLYPGEFSAPLQCRLESIDIEHAPPYEPLSYTWGQDPSNSVIYINNAPLPIKPNLESALRHLRFPLQSRRLWIDALCIDQSSTYERSQQVSYMREVYLHGARTIVWLGLPTPGVDIAFELTERLSSVNKGVRTSLSDKGADPRIVCAPGEIDYVTYRAVITAVLQDFPENAMDLLCELFQRQYFQRAWCVQEVLVCSWAIARCGELEMPFYDLLSGAGEVGGEKKKSMEDIPLAFWANLYYKKFKIKGRFIGGASEDTIGTLSMALTTLRDFKATDPRDKIYSLLGIVDEALLLKNVPIEATSSRSRIDKLVTSGTNRLLRFVNGAPVNSMLIKPRWFIPDYNLQLVEVYKMITIFLLMKKSFVEGTLVHVMHHTQPDPSWPSWIPKWFEPRPFSGIDLGHFRAGLDGRTSEYHLETRGKALDTDKMWSDVLSADGFNVDHIETVGKVMSFEHGKRFTLQYLWQQIFGESSVPCFDRKYFNGNLLVNALLFTLVAEGWGHWHSYLPEKRFPLTSSREQSYHMLENLIRADIAAFLLLNHATFDPPLTTDTITSLSADSHNSDLPRFLVALPRTSNNRRLFITGSGMLGLGPTVMKSGDQVCVLFGQRVPYILRRVQDHYQLIGDAYVHNRDIMWGRYTDRVKNGTGNISATTFDIH